MNNVSVWTTKQKTRRKESCFFDEVKSEWDFWSSIELSFFGEISMGMWQNVLRVLNVCMGGMVLGKEM